MYIFDIQKSQVQIFQQKVNQNTFYFSVQGSDYFNMKYIFYKY